MEHFFYEWSERQSSSFSCSSFAYIRIHVQCLSDCTVFPSVMDHNILDHNIFSLWVMPYIKFRIVDRPCIEVESTVNQYRSDAKIANADISIGAEQCLAPQTISRQQSLISIRMEKNTRTHSQPCLGEISPGMLSCKRANKHTLRHPHPYKIFRPPSCMQHPEYRTFCWSVHIRLSIQKNQCLQTRTYAQTCQTFRNDTNTWWDSGRSTNAPTCSENEHDDDDEATTTTTTTTAANEPWICSDIHSPLCCVAVFFIWFYLRCRMNRTDNLFGIYFITTKISNLLHPKIIRIIF